MFDSLINRRAWRLCSLRLAFVFFCLSLACSVNAQETLPALTGRVVDLAELLDSSRESALSAQLEAHQNQTSNQLVVVTLPSLNGNQIADYANRLARFWEIGTAENDNGVLLMVAPEERKVRIEVGYGLEGALTDSLSSIIIQREILPPFRSDNYALGIQQGVDAIIAAIAGEYQAPDSSDSRSDPISDKVGSFLPLIFIAMVGIPEVLRRRGLKKAAKGAFPAGFAGLFGTVATGNLFIGLAAAVVAFLFVYFIGSDKGGGGTGTGRRHSGGFAGGGRLGGGSFGGGGGGFSGGGGSFGGGGASGSW